jgi:hypothetical protein
MVDFNAHTMPSQQASELCFPAAKPRRNDRIIRETLRQHGGRSILANCAINTMAFTA